MRKIWKSSNASNRPENKILWPESMTIPDETYSIRDLFKKHASGMFPEHLDRPTQYADYEMSHEDLDYQEVQRMDIHDKAELIQQQKLKASRLKDEIKVAQTTQKPNEAVASNKGDTTQIERGGLSEETNAVESRTL